MTLLQKPKSGKLENETKGASPPLFRLRTAKGMGPPIWEACSDELDKHLVGEVSKKLAYRQLPNREKLKALRLLSGFDWSRRAMRTIDPHGISAVVLRAARNPATRPLASALRAKLREIWTAPPELHVSGPHKWRGYISTSVLYSRAPEEA